jgi:hypothetical protein
MCDHPLDTGKVIICEAVVDARWIAIGDRRTKQCSSVAVELYGDFLLHELSDEHAVCTSHSMAKSIEFICGAVVIQPVRDPFAHQRDFLTSVRELAAARS